MHEISIGRLRGGFCVYWDEDGKRRRYQLAARTRKEAESEGRDLYLKETKPKAGMNTRQLWDAYIHHLGSKPTAKTMGWTGKAVLAYFGELRPDQVTIDDCRQYLRDRMQDGKKIGTVHTELGHLRSTYKWASKLNLIDKVPHIELPPKPDSDVRPIPDKDIVSIIDHCIAPHSRLAVILLFATGARMSAVLELTWSQIDFERGMIDLRKPDGVTRKGRATVPMNRMARTALQAAYTGRETQWVVEYNGNPIKSMRTAYKAALGRAELDNINIHQIRHTVAVKMLTGGTRIEKVSQYLGHSNIQITQKIYARFMPEHLENEAEILNIDKFNELGSTS